MLNTVLYAIQKFKLLLQIRKLAHTSASYHQVSSGQIAKISYSAAIMNKKEHYIAQLVALLSKDQRTKNVLKAHHLKFDHLNAMISTLEQHGAGCIKKGHYVAVSAVACSDTLQFLCNYWDGQNFKIGNFDAHFSNKMIANQVLDIF